MNFCHAMCNTDRLLGDRMKNTHQWMIYGANGYTGELIAREAARRGLAPVIAGRNRDSIEALAAELSLESRVFGLGDENRVVEAIKGCELVLNCAGPFSATATQMMEACLAAGTHYLDITGEIAVLELAQALNERAKRAGVVLCPGVGFDVIPTDCVAASLKAALPDATHLALGFDSRSGLSPGTAKTSIEGMAEGGKVRRDGKIVSVPLAWEVRRIDFGDGEKQAMTIPWGDVSTAFYSTGIPDIRVFVPASPRMTARARRANWVRPLLKLKWLQKFIQARISKSVKGPSEAQRQALPTYVWGEATNARGERKTARIRTANGYSLTVDGSLYVVNYVLTNGIAPGAYTPAMLVGQRLVIDLPGSSAITVE